MTNTDTKIFLLKLLELSVVVFRGPDAETWDKIASAGVPELLDRVQQNPDFVAPIMSFDEALTACSHSPEGFDILETEYVRLFIAGQGGVPAPLYESVYSAEKQTMGQSALEMRTRLEQAGLAVSLDSNEPPDHLSIELEYVFYLLSEGWFGDDVKAAMGADFAKTVVLPWVTLFHDKLAKANPHPVFKSMADIIVAVLAKVDDA